MVVILLRMWKSTGFFFVVVCMQANGLPSFPVDATYVPATLRRVTLAVEVDKVLRRHQQVIQLDKFRSTMHI